MTTLYRPVVIESAEQAEALWRDAVVVIARNPNGSPYAVVFGGEVLHPDTWAMNDWFIGWTALVPIEAEEETREHPYRVEERPESAYLQPVVQTRLVTPWEEA